MQSGRLDRRIRIEQLGETIDAAGGVAEGWTVFAQPWANYRPLRGSETFTAQQELSVREGVFTIRYRDGLTADMRIVWDKRNWDIKHIGEVSRRNRVEITASSQGA